MTTDSFRLFTLCDWLCVCAQGQEKSVSPAPVWRVIDVWQTHCMNNGVDVLQWRKNSLSPQNIWWNFHSTSYFCSTQCVLWTVCKYLFLDSFFMIRLHVQRVEIFHVGYNCITFSLTIYDKQIVHKGSIRHFFNVFEGSLAHQACIYSIRN